MGRFAAPVAAAALVLAACASGSDGGDDVPPAVPEPVEVEASDDGDLLDEAEDSTDDAESSDGDAPLVESELPVCPNLPPNVWPEDCIPVEDGGDGEDADASGDDSVANDDSVVEEDASVDVIDAAGSGKDGIVTSVEDGGVQPDGFSTITARVTSPDGDVCEVCLWLADSRDERARGLMDVTDLGDAVGMAFVWGELVDGNFWMFQTPTPLSIAFFDDAGDHAGQADMDPCAASDSDLCVRYGADRPYSVAVEMFGGQLGEVGIAPGSSIELVAGTESSTCPLA